MRPAAQQRAQLRQHSTPPGSFLGLQNVTELPRCKHEQQNINKIGQRVSEWAKVAEAGRERGREVAELSRRKHEHHNINTTGEKGFPEGPR